MNQEVLDFAPREPAIPEHELMTPEGPANKKTLQILAGRFGLPVPDILTYDEAVSFLVEGERLENEDQHRFYTQGGANKYRVFGRGVMEYDSLDMFAVDLLPTGDTCRSNDLFPLIKKMNEELDMRASTAYLKRNFGKNALANVEYFFQKATPAYMYFSTLTMGPNMYIAGNSNIGRGVNWLALDDGDVVADDHWNFEDQEEQLINLSREASFVLNQAFVSRKTDFEFKHDILWDPGSNEFTLIQSRVASRKMTRDAIVEQNDTVWNLAKSGIPIISLEPSELGKLRVDRVSKRPFILELTNDRHDGVASRDVMMSLDLSQMVGLILPEDLRGGALHHGMYVPWALANYWGVPVSLSA